jgi:hypothetical protein
VLVGAYCHECGQKRFVDGDRRLSHLVGAAFHELTALDGKLLRSLRLLLFRPGLLSREYLDGRRARYYSPIGLFVLANVLYFFAPALSDFNLSFIDQVPGRIGLQAIDPAAPLSPARRERIERGGGQLHSELTAPLVERMLARRQADDPSYDLRRLADDYDRRAGDVGKALMIVHVPVLALALAIVYWRRRWYFAEHFVVALHLFTFLLLFVQLVIAPVHWVSERIAFELPALAGPLLRFTLGGLIITYMARACRRAYATTRLGPIAGLIAVLVGLYIANLWLYRALQFVITLAVL